MVSACAVHPAERKALTVGMNTLFRGGCESGVPRARLNSAFVCSCVALYFLDSCWGTVCFLGLATCSVCSGTIWALGVGLYS